MNKPLRSSPLKSVVSLSLGDEVDREDSTPEKRESSEIEHRLGNEPTPNEEAGNDPPATIARLYVQAPDPAHGTTGRSSRRGTPRSYFDPLTLPQRLKNTRIITPVYAGEMRGTIISRAPRPLWRPSPNLEWYMESSEVSQLSHRAREMDEEAQKLETDFVGKQKPSNDAQGPEQQDSNDLSDDEWEAYMRSRERNGFLEFSGGLDFGGGKYEYKDEDENKDVYEERWNGEEEEDYSRYDRSPAYALEDPSALLGGRIFPPSSPDRDIGEQHSNEHRNDGNLYFTV